MKVLVFAVFAMIAGSVKAQGPASGPMNQVSNQRNPMMPGQGPQSMQGQGSQMMQGQGSQMMQGQGSQMMQGQGYQMSQGQGYQTMPSQGPQMMQSQSYQMMPGQSHHMSPIANQLYAHGNNMYSNNYMSQNGAYGSQQGANQGEQSALSMMPFFFGGDRGRRFAMMNMMMNPKQGGMNSVAPLLFIDGAMEGGMWPLMAMAGNRGSKINPMMMVAASSMA